MAKLWLRVWCLVFLTHSVYSNCSYLIYRRLRLAVSVKHWTGVRPSVRLSVRATSNNSSGGSTEVASARIGLDVPAAKTTFSKFGGPISWSEVLLPFSRKKLERYTQLVTLSTRPPPKSYVKSWGSVQFFFWGGSGPPFPRPPVVARAETMVSCCVTVTRW